MKIAVISANGRTGRAFVREALAAGHSVHAGILGEDPFIPHKNLITVKCDATKEDDLRRLLADQDCVTSFIGHVKGSPANIQEVAVRALITVMTEMGMRRIVSLTGTGVRETGDAVSIVDRLLNVCISIVDPNRVYDGRKHAEVLKASTLEWTIIRVLKLQNIRVKDFTLAPHGPTKWYVGRAEVAMAVLQVLEQHTFIKQMPIISRPPQNNFDE